MPKLKLTYPLTVIYYVLQHKSLPVEKYVGSTTNFERRLAVHKYDATNSNSKNYNFPIYVHIRENDGWNNWEMIDLSVEIVENKHERNNIENLFINELGATLNQVSPGAVQRAGGKREYILKHNKRDLATEYLCECGGKTSWGKKARHIKGSMHQVFLKTGQKKTQTERCGCGGNIGDEKHRQRHIKSTRHQKYLLELKCGHTTDQKNC